MLHSAHGVPVCRPPAVLPRRPPSRPATRPSSIPTRRYSHKPHEPYAPFQINRETAVRLFHEKDGKRLFAPLKCEVKQQIQGITLWKEDPIKQEFIGMFFSKANINCCGWSGQYGKDRYEIKTNSKGETKIEHHIDWYPASGIVGFQSYDENMDGAAISGEIEKYDTELVEDALGNFSFKHLLVPFDLEKMKNEGHVNNFVRKAAIAREIATARINLFEEARCRNDLMKQAPWANHYTISHINPQYENLTLNGCFLPAYILQYPDNPPRIMSAVDTNISGGGEISIIKSMTLGTVVTFGLSFLFPWIRPVQILAAVGGGLASALFANNFRKIQYYNQQKRLDKEWDKNESVAESASDRRRRLLTEGIQDEPAREIPVEEHVKGKVLKVAEIHFKNLGLNPIDPMTKKIVLHAYRMKALKHHPDRGGSVEKMHGLTNSRDALLAGLGKKSKVKRHYSTAAPVKVKMPPRSSYDPMAGQLIHVVLEEKNYKKALRMVQEEDVPVDAHDRGENTLLTEAAKKGDLKAVEFALSKLEASPDTSCDCPKHRTALHYAAKNGNAAIVEALLKHGANPNLIDSDGFTPLDVATNNNNTASINVLKSHGAVRNEERTLWKKIAGYSSEERTILVEGKQAPVIAPRKRPK